ncbi:MAG: PadR family transcriptional regulator [Gemmatimonadetes bacterium]|nr:PadR family transcriptional regulator [Gemmatimonadota bacterium]
MSPRRPDPIHMLPLSRPVFHILLALADGERHGYAIMQEVQERSGGEVRIGPGTLYGAIKRLLRQGVVAEAATGSHAEDDERRRYYALTPLGRSVLMAEADRLESLVKAVRAKKLKPRARPS